MKGGLGGFLFVLFFSGDSFIYFLKNLLTSKYNLKGLPKYNSSQDASCRHKLHYFCNSLFS
jgi:hypothetical protein